MQVEILSHVLVSLMALTVPLLKQPDDSGSLVHCFSNTVNFFLIHSHKPISEKQNEGCDEPIERRFFLIRLVRLNNGNVATKVG